jgi:hypothetical protein
VEEVKVKVPPGRLLVKGARCPKGCSLMAPEHPLSAKPSIKALLRLRGRAGFIYFNPYYGIFEYDSELVLRPGDVVEVFCPKCETSLMGEERCHLCGVPMITLQLPHGGEVRACPVVGCHNHALTIVDLDAQLAELYDEERRPKM